MKKFRKIFKFGAIFLMMLVFLFSNFAPVLLNKIGQQKLAENLEVKEARAAQPNSMMVYAKTDGIPYYIIWNGTSWGGELSATAVGGDIQYIVLKFSRTREEAILGTLDSTGDIRTQTWNGSNWSATTLHANIGTTNDAYRGFDIEYETNGDRAIIVYNDANVASPAYKIWSGSSWSGATSITVPTTVVPLWIELAPKPQSSSNEIAMLLLASNTSTYGMVWTGSAWSNMGVSTVWDSSVSLSTKKAIDVAYEQGTGRAFFAWNWSGGTRTRTWNGTTLGSTGTMTIASGGAGEWIKLAPDPYSDKIMVGVQDAGADLNTRVWLGTGWDAANVLHDATVEDILDMNFDISYETYSGNAGKAWIAWGDGARVSTNQWSGSAWGSPTTSGDDTAYITLFSNPANGVIFMGVYQDSGSASDDILEAHLTGGSSIWSADAQIWAGPVVANPVMFRIAIASDKKARPNATSFVNNTEGTLLDGARTSQSITITGTNFGNGPCDGTNNAVKIGTYTLSCTGSSWSNTSITITIDSGINVFGGIGSDGLIVRSDSLDDLTPLDFYVYPNITSITGTPIADAQREGSNIDLNGTRFDTSANPGTINFTGGFGTITANVISWSDTLVTVTVPTAISDNVYLGDITLTRAAITNSKSDNAYDTNAFRILPKIDSTSPINLKGGRGDTISISGDHLCQSGTCPILFSAANSVNFNGGSVTSGVSIWTDTSIPSIVIPAGALDGNLNITSNTTYVSNNLTYDIKFSPTTPTNASPAGESGVSLNPTLNTLAFSDGTDGDSHLDSEWQIDEEGTFATPEWTETLASANISVVVNNTNGSFGGLLSGETSLACAKTYYFRARHKDNGGITSQEWSSWSSYSSFLTASCGPDATSITNNNEPALSDGGRIGHIIVISGGSFGTVNAGSRATCAGGAGTGCVKIGGTGGQTIADSRVTAWSNTSITIQLSLTDLTTTYGGATTNGIIVYGAGVADPDGLTFYIYPDIASLSVTEAREGDTITINGNKFGAGSSGGNVAILGVVATTGAWTETSISATIPDGINDATDSGYVIVTQGTGTNNKSTNSTDPQASLVMLPRITGISVASFSDGGFQDGTFTLNGSHFGALAGSISVNSQAQDGTPTWGVSTITSVGIPNTGTDSGSIILTRTDAKTSNSWSTFYIYPQITGFTAVKGDGDIQTGTITISGNHFGTGGLASSILINTAAPSSIGAWGTGSITTVDIPNTGADSGVIKVTNPQTSKQSNDSTAFYIYPQIISLTVPTAIGDAAREYSGSDSDGLISVNGNHFGASAGTITILGTSAPTYVSWGATLISTLQVPTAIADNSYTGAIALTRSDTKPFSYAGFRILPRIISLDPNTGVVNDSIVIIGNHFCQSGTCPLAGSRSTSADNVKFYNNVQVSDANVTAWGHGDSSASGVTANVPAGAATGDITVRSNTDYTSNGINFILVTPTPNDPASLGQFRNSGYTDSISVGGAASSTAIYFQMTMEALVSGGILYPQIEAKPIGTAFTGTFTAEGAGVAGPGPVTGQVSTTLTTNTKYHWQARVRHNKSGADYYSNWVSFGGNTDPNDIDFYIDATAPTLGSCPFHSSVVSSGATISWVPSDAMSTTFTKQVQYSTDSSFTSSTCSPGSICGTPTSGYTSGSQIVNLTSLGPNTVYYYRVRSKDEAGNEGVAGYGLSGDTACTFTTSKAETRTTEFYVITKTDSLGSGSEYTAPFSVYISESDYSIQSAFIEMSGVFSTDATPGAGSDVKVRVNSQADVTYTIGTSDTVTTPFNIIHQVPMANLSFATPSAPNNSNTFGVTVMESGRSITVVSAKIVVTYYHTPVQ